MHKKHHRHDSRAPAGDTSTGDIAALYNRAGDQYLVYADGDPERLFCFEGLHAYADRQLWSLLERKLNELRTTGASAARILDAGCGPGTWLRRCVTHARRLGFTKITARGFDVAQTQIEVARLKALDLAGLPGVTLSFDVADLTEALPEADGAADITLCLYSVLNHLPRATLPKIVAEIARITAGCFITTVRSIGSNPTISVNSIEEARHLNLDHVHDRCEVEFHNGYRAAFAFHLFTASELRNCFSPHFAIEDLHGLDIFHNRFLPDRRWNPASIVVDERVMLHLAQLEEKYATDPVFMERGMHLLLVGGPPPAHTRGRARQHDGHEAGAGCALVVPNIGRDARAS